MGVLRKTLFIDEMALSLKYSKELYKKNIQIE